MRTIPGRPSPAARLARALGLDGNPLRRASDRAEAWIRVGVLVVFLAALPPALTVSPARTAGLAKGGGQRRPATPLAPLWTGGKP